MKKLSVIQKALLINVVIILLGLIVFGILWALSVPYGMGMFLGWIVGTVVGLINYGLITLQGYLIQNSIAQSKTGLFSTLLYFFRFLLAGAVLVLAAWLMWEAKNPVINIWTVVGGIIAMTIGVRFSGAESPWSKDNPLNGEKKTKETKIFSPFGKSDIKLEEEYHDPVDDGEIRE